VDLIHGYSPILELVRYSFCPITKDSI